MATLVISVLIVGGVLGLALLIVFWADRPGPHDGPGSPSDTTAGTDGFWLTTMMLSDSPDSGSHHDSGSGD